MPNVAWIACRGFIRGLCLPQYAWRALYDAEITTLDQLRAVADQVEQFVPGIGPKMAEVIRQELARIAEYDRERKSNPISFSS